MLILNSFKIWHFILARPCIVDEELEWFPRVEQEIPQLLIEIRVENSPVPVVSDAPAVHGLADELLQ